MDWKGLKKGVLAIILVRDRFLLLLSPSLPLFVLYDPTTTVGAWGWPRWSVGLSFSQVDWVD